jgi:hypothetical protein
MFRRLLIVTFVTLGCLAPSSASSGYAQQRATDPPSPQSSAAPREPRRALLIGVTQYLHLPADKQLSGSENDVALMRRVLEERLDFRANEIHVLTGEGASGEAIRRELESLCQWLVGLPPGSPRAQVVFHFSGHGSQLPDQAFEGRDEIDGLDETIVPADATALGGEQDIRDDELNDYAHRICGDGKARLWFILDCCHSGTGTRSLNATPPGLVRYRTLKRDLTPTRTVIPSTVRTLPVGAVALYACQAMELEPEYSDGQRTYGLLTRFLAQVLLVANLAENLTFATLRDAIAARYRQDRSVGLSAPSPQLEGSPSLLDSAVVSQSEDNSRWCWEVRSESSHGRLLAGSFHGVTEGSILELYEFPEQVQWESAALDQPRSGTSLGLARVEKMQAAASTVSMVRWSGSDWVTSRWPSNVTTCYAVERLHRYGDFGLSVAVYQTGEQAGIERLTEDRLPEAIAEVFRPRGQESSDDEQRSVPENWLSFAPSEQPADLYLKIHRGEVAAFPLIGGSAEPMGDQPAAQPLVGGWGPVDLASPDAAGSLRRMLRQITRARNLLRIAARDAADGDAGPVKVTLELLKVPDPKPPFNTIPWPAADPSKSPAEYQMKSGEFYSYRVTNLSSGPRPVHVTILHLNSDMGIELVLPYQSATGIQGLAECELQPGESRVEGPFRCNGVDEPSFGARHTIVLATREPNQFYMLNQPSLLKVVGERTRGSEHSSLTELLLQGNDFLTRSARRRPQTLYDDSWGSTVLEWTVVRSFSPNGLF